MRYKTKNIVLSSRELRSMIVQELKKISKPSLLEVGPGARLDLKKSMSNEFAVEFRDGKFTSADDHNELDIYELTSGTPQQIMKLQHDFDRALTSKKPVVAADKLDDKYSGVSVFVAGLDGPNSPGQILLDTLGLLYDDEGFAIR